MRQAGQTLRRLKKLPRGEVLCGHTGTAQVTKELIHLHQLRPAQKAKHSAVACLCLTSLYPGLTFTNVSQKRHTSERYSRRV